MITATKATSGVIRMAYRNENETKVMPVVFRIFLKVLNMFYSPVLYIYNIVKNGHFVNGNNC